MKSEVSLLSYAKTSKKRVSTKTLKMKSTLVKMYLVTTVISMSSCSEVNRRVDEKVQLLEKRAGELDSLLTNEFKKVQRLDTIINDEIAKSRRLDSVIQRSRIAVDSLLNKK